MIDEILLASTGHGESLFTPAESDWLEKRIFERKTKKGKEYAVPCIVRGKDIRLTPEEIVRQLYAHRLMEEYGYPASRLAFEFPVHFGRETKRADIVVRDKDDPNVPYIIVETKKPNAKDGREQLKSYTLATGATMAVWTNGEAITFHQRKNPNFFEDIPGIPKADETLADILNTPFTMDDLVREDKLTKTGKSLKDLVLEMEDEVLANAGVDVFEEVFKLIFAKLYDEKTGTNHAGYNLRFRNSGQSDIELKRKIEALFKEACDEWPGVFDDSAAIALTPPHLAICVSSLETVKLFNSNLDVVDDAFEYLMNKSSKGEKGQYFTPRYVIDMCVRMLNPRPSETMIDTAAGSSGFPVHTIFHVWRQMQLDANEKVSHLFTSAPKSKAQTDYVRSKVFAIDFDEKTVRVARTLNLIAGDGHTNVLHLNTLDFGRWDTVTKDQGWIDTYNEGWKKLRKLEIDSSHTYFEFDIVMANPPFAGEIKEGQLLSRYEFGSKRGKPQKSVSRDVLFIERNINFLGAGGRMAIVLPQGRFNNATDQEIRRFIADKCRILAVVGLDGNTFKPHTGTKTSVLFVQRWQNDRNQPNYNPKRDDYPIFFATQRREGKNSRGDKLYWTRDKSGTTTDPKRALLDQYGHPIVYHDLFATYNYVWDEDAKTNRLEQLTPDGIAEAFAQFAAREKLSFFPLSPFDKARYGDLLKGLEISEVRLKDVENRTPDFRMEAEFFTAAKHSFNSVRGEDAIVFSQYGTSEELNEQGKGYPVLRLNEFDCTFIGRPTKYCELSPAEFAELQLRDGDVLICRTNGNPKLVGKSALVPRDYQYAFASYLFRVRPNLAIINPETLVAYLNSRFGRREIERFAMRGNQANFSPAKFRQIQIPVLGPEVNNAIKELTRKAFSNNEKSKTLYREAEQMLLAELGFDGWSPTDESISIKSCSDFIAAGRFDAEYFQPKYDELFALLGKCFTRNLGGVGGLVGIMRSSEPGSDAYSDKGVPFVRIADFSEMGITPPEIHLPPEVCADIPRPRKDTILLSKDGSVGIAYKVEEDLGMVTSSGILHLSVKDPAVLPDYLTLVLNSPIVRLQAERDAGGSIIQHWKEAEIKRVKIPLLPIPDQEHLADKVRSSFALRAESRRLLDLAKRTVETAIEQGEQPALRMMEAITTGDTTL